MAQKPLVLYLLLALPASIKSTNIYPIGICRSGLYYCYIHAWSCLTPSTWTLNWTPRRKILLPHRSVRVPIWRASQCRHHGSTAAAPPVPCCLPQSPESPSGPAQTPTAAPMSGGLHDAPFRERVIRSHRSGHDDADPRTAVRVRTTVTVRSPFGHLLGRETWAPRVFYIERSCR